MGTKNIGALFAILVIVMGLWGCSQEGNLTVRNECATEFQGHIDNQSVVIDTNMEYNTTVYIGKTLALVGPTDIVIDISGGAWTRRDFTDRFSVKSGETTLYRITSDVGACDFTNDYSLSVNALSVKHCDSTRFDPNLLEKNQKLSPGDKHLIQLDQGCWDVLVNYGREEFLDTVTAVHIKIGEVDTVKWVPGFGDEIISLAGARP